MGISLHYLKKKSEKSLASYAETKKDERCGVMERTITLDGVEYKLVPVDETKESNRRTGYERVGLGERYFYTNMGGDLASTENNELKLDELAIDSGNAVIDKQLGEDRARRTRLLWQLERFSAENRETPIDWDNINQHKYYISYDYTEKNLLVGCLYSEKDTFQIYFDSEELSEKAIKEFHDELIWFFTEYQDTAEFRD